MARVCDLCGKGPIVVNSVTRRGKARADGGVGRKTTGISKSRQLPNLQPLKLRQGGAVVQLRVCTKCRRSVQAV